MHPFARASFPEGPESKQAVMVSASALLYHYYTGYISIQVRPRLHQASASTLRQLCNDASNSVATHFQVTPLFSRTTVLLVSSQNGLSIDTDVRCKQVLGKQNLAHESKQDKTGYSPVHSVYDKNSSVLFYTPVVFHYSLQYFIAST